MDKRVYSRIPRKCGNLIQKKPSITTEELANEELDKAQIKKVSIPSNTFFFRVYFIYF